MKAYIKTFSMRELYSALFTALMQVSLLFFIKQIDQIKQNYYLAFLIIIIPLVLSHRMYLLEHKRRNRFWGRLMHDLLIILFLFILLSIFLKIAGTFYIIGFYSDLAFLITILVLCVELALTLINKIILLFKWQIW